MTVMVRSPFACISLGIGRFCANSVGFRWSSSLLPYLCPLCVPWGGGYVGYIRKALEKGYLEHPGSACCTDDMFEIFVRFGRYLLLAASSIAPSCALPNLKLYLLKNVTPPPNPYISETAFSHRFQKIYTYPPQSDEILARWTKSSQNGGKMPKPTVLAHNE